MEATIETVRGGATPTETIDRILTLARRQLGMDVSFVAEIENGAEPPAVTVVDATPCRLLDAERELSLTVEPPVATKPTS